jgi:PadR family transcriptional regulator PadR
MERHIQPAGEFAAEVAVGIGFLAAETVMQVGGVKHQAAFFARVGQGAQQGHRVCSAGKSDSYAHARIQQGGVERKCGPGWHERIIARFLRDSVLHRGYFIAIVELMAERSYFGELELMLLLAVIQLGEEAYGVPIARQIEKFRGKEVAVGSVYAALERLEAKGLITSMLGDPTPERGGKAKRFFRVTKEGLRQVHETRSVLTRLWQAIPDLKLDMPQES